MFRLLGKVPTVNRAPEPSQAKEVPVDWLSCVSIKGSTAPFENVPSVAHYGDDEAWVKFDGLKLEHSLRTYMANDPHPIPATADREGYYGPRHHDYWLSGLKDYLCIKAALARNGGQLTSSSSIFDFGCASGRVLRHFLCQESDLDIWGADINARHAEWIRRFLPGRVKVFQNTVLPHLPLEDSSISVVYAFSVFTHIDRFELAWLAELRRVLKRGGFAYLTIHSDHTWQTMNPKRQLYVDLLAMKDSIPDYRVSPELFKKPMPAEKTVFSWHSAYAAHASVFHSTEYIKSTWGRFLDVVEFVREGHDYQDVVLLRKG